MSAPNGNVLASALREHRPLLLALEAIGWLHMTGKAREAFLRGHGGQKNDHDDLRWHERETPPFPWADLLTWVRERPWPSVQDDRWPRSLTDFLTRHRGRNDGLLGLLQAAHAMASGIEKQSYPDRTVEYLGQDVTHMWLTTAFGCPVRNLLADPPPLLTDGGWRDLLHRIRTLLIDQQGLGKNAPADVASWWRWRENAIGQEGWLRLAYSSTLAETRLPNNDVTLWDQAYVAAALFKSAAAGAVLAGSSFSWQGVKQKTRWRLLTVGVGTDHYEARAVRIGDWTGTRQVLKGFFEQVRRLVEVDLAVGSLLYRDGQLAVFSFPADRDDGGGLSKSTSDALMTWVNERVEEYAQAAKLETPPYCAITDDSSRSLVGMTREIQKARSTLAVPAHRSWEVPATEETQGHVCPVCQVRFNRDPNDKQRVCDPCHKRRTGRRDAWLSGDLGEDTIWISEVADENDRLALITLNFDLLPWLDGSCLDGLRTQAASEWRRHNPILEGKDNPIDPKQPYDALVTYIRGKLEHFDKKDQVLRSLQAGYQHASDWPTFFQLIVEDRSDAPSWDKLDDDQRARWIVHQLLRKNPSPGRVRRFWQSTEVLFTRHLARFREVASSSANRWRVRRLLLVPDVATRTAGWLDGEIYNGRCIDRSVDAPVSLLWRKELGGFVTACNLARLLGPADKGALLKGAEFDITTDDGRVRRLKVQEVRELDGHLGVYAPLIPLDLDPERFRVLVPLEAVADCIEAVIAAWTSEFARVWDRLPLRAGVVAFPRMVPFQAVIEMTRSLEANLAETRDEVWRVDDLVHRDGVVALSCVRPDGAHDLLTVPERCPDGRGDLFYPYVAVTDRILRCHRDFQHPNGQVFRHMTDLRRGDGIRVHPARVATVFLDSTGRRFEPIESQPLTDWNVREDTWALLARAGSSKTALRGAWSTIAEAREGWSGPDNSWLPDGETEWLALTRAVLANRIGLRGAPLDSIVEAARMGTLRRTLEWHMSVLKTPAEENPYDQ